VSKEGVTKSWNDQLEILFDDALVKVQGFGERDLILSLRDKLKYDGRTRKGKLASKRIQIRLAMASDDDLADLAKCEAGLGADMTEEEIFERLVKRRQVLQLAVRGN